MNVLRPACVCTALLAALDASEGRSRIRKRDQTPDGIGLAMRRVLLISAARDDPEPAAFEQWLFDHVEASGDGGAVQAIARAVLDEWRLANRLGAFTAWLEKGAPSEDAQGQTAHVRMRHPARG